MRCDVPHIEEGKRRGKRGEKKTAKEKVSGWKGVRKAKERRQHIARQ